jgi:hypothetical protein
MHPAPIVSETPKIAVAVPTIARSEKSFIKI